MDSKHSDDDYIINDTEYEEDEADIVCCRWITINRGLISGVSGYEFAEQKKILSNDLLYQ